MELMGSATYEGKVTRALMGINFTAGAVLGRKLYGGRSQQKVVDLGKPATRLGKACREQREYLGSRALRLGMAVAASELEGTSFKWAGAHESMRAAREFQSSVSALPSPLPARACEKGGENAERTQTRSRPRSLAATLAALPSMSLNPSAPFACRLW